MPATAVQVPKWLRSPIKRNRPISRRHRPRDGHKMKCTLRKRTCRPSKESRDAPPPDVPKRCLASPEPRGQSCEAPHHSRGAGASGRVPRLRQCALWPGWGQKWLRRMVVPKQTQHRKRPRARPNHRRLHRCRRRRPLPSLSWSLGSSFERVRSWFERWWAGFEQLRGRSTMRCKAGDSTLLAAVCVIQATKRAFSFSISFWSPRVFWQPFGCVMQARLRLQAWSTFCTQSIRRYISTLLPERNPRLHFLWRQSHARSMAMAETCDAKPEFAK